MGGECKVKRGLHQVTAAMDDAQCRNTLRPSDDRYGPVFLFSMYSCHLFEFTSPRKIVCGARTLHFFTPRGERRKAFLFEWTY